MGKGITAIGNLDRRVIIEQSTTAVDEYGHSTVSSWATFATVWATKMIKPRLESMEDDQRVGGERVTWQIRYRADITSKMRVTVGTQYYSIESTEEVARDRRLNLHTQYKDSN